MDIDDRKPLVGRGDVVDLIDGLILAQRHKRTRPELEQQELNRQQHCRYRTAECGCHSGCGAGREQRFSAPLRSS